MKHRLLAVAGLVSIMSVGAAVHPVLVTAEPAGVSLTMAIVFSNLSTLLIGGGVALVDMIRRRRASVPAST